MKKTIVLMVAFLSVGLSAADGANEAMVPASAVRDVPPVVAPYRVQAAKNLAKNALWLAAAVATIKFTSKALADDEKARMIELHRKNLAEGYQDMLLEYEEKYKKELTRQELAQRYGMRVPNQHEMQKIVADDLAVLRSADEQVLGRADLLPEDEDQDSGESLGMGVTVPQAVVEPKMLAPWQRSLYQGLYAAAWGMVIFQGVGVLSNLKAWWHDKEQMPSVWNRLQDVRDLLKSWVQVFEDNAKSIVQIKPLRALQIHPFFLCPGGEPTQLNELGAAVALLVCEAYKNGREESLEDECNRQAADFCGQVGLSLPHLRIFLHNQKALAAEAGERKWLSLPKYLEDKQQEVLAHNKRRLLQRILRSAFGQPYWANVLTSAQTTGDIFTGDRKRVIDALARTE